MNWNDYAPRPPMGAPKTPQPNASAGTTVPNKAVRIGRFQRMMQPCWVFDTRSAKWHHLDDDPNTCAILLSEGNWWHPDQPTAPTCVPEDNLGGDGKMGEEKRSLTPPSVSSEPTPGAQSVPDWAMEAAKKLRVFGVSDEHVAAVIAAHAPSVPAVGVREALRSAIEDRIKFDLPDESLDQITAALTPYLSAAQGAAEQMIAWLGDPNATEDRFDEVQKFLREGDSLDQFKDAVALAMMHSGQPLKLAAHPTGEGDTERINWIEQMAADCEGHILTRLFIPDGKPFRDKVDALRSSNQTGEARG